MTRILHLLTVVAALALLGGAPVRADAAPPVAAVVHLVDDGARARLSFDLSAPVMGRAREIANPDRIVLDMPEVDFRLKPEAGRLARHADALIKAFRFGLFGPGKSRVVIDLARPACVADVETRRLVRGQTPSRLTLALRACAETAFAAAALDHQPPPAAAPAPAPTAVAQGLPVIVLDPGHGGVDGGAYGLDGAVEKTLVYAFALVLRDKLEATGRYRVVMTRVGDQYVSLEDRVAKARAANAALFVSIHADTLRESAAVSGTTVYTCSDRASDAQAQRVAESENAADREAGETPKAADPGVADILYDLKRRETRAYAHLLSHGLVARLSQVGELNHNPERSAGFVVLKAPDFPSVLIELGYLTNARDVANLRSPQWRDKMAEAMRQAIDGFFAKADPEKADPSADAQAASAPGSKPSP